MKPSSTFKFSKSSKRMLCTMINAEQRNAWKRCMIEAELYSKIVVKPSKKERTAPSAE
jgi:hypothetical protein